MKKKIIALTLTLTTCFMSLYAPVYGDETEENNEVYLDVSDISSIDEFYDKYAEQFNGADIKLYVDDDGFEYLPELKNFDFNSLDLVIDLAGHYLFFQKELEFPENLKSVEIKYNGEDTLTQSDELDNFITALWVDCPQSTINDMSADEAYDWIRSNDTLGLLDTYEANAKLNYVFDLAEGGKLETAEGKPVYSGRLIFKIIDEAGITSVEAAAFGESFYDMDSTLLAENFDEADTAVFIYPVSSLIGTYANGGEARCMYTEVCVVDLNTMKMYEPFAAVKNDPPENLEINIKDGKYSTDGVEGEYEPDKAMEQILKTIGGKTATVDSNSENKELKEELLPWYLPEDNQSSVMESAIKAAAEAIKSMRESEKSETAAENTAEEATTPVDTIAETTASSETTTPADNAAETTASSETTASADNAAETTVSSETTASAETTAQAETNIIPDTAKEAAASPYSWLTDELLEQIFEALGDETYKNTYTLIKNGKNLAYGSKGDAALGLQKTLAAFGENLSTDSSVGNSTLGALKDVQTALGQTYTDKLTSKAYSLLMPALLIHLNSQAAEELLMDMLTFPDGSMYEYLEAGLCYINGRNYSAKELYESSKYDNYQDMMKNCVDSEPEAGEIYRDTDYAKKEAGLSISVNNSDESAYTCVKIYSLDGQLVSSVIVNNIQPASIYLPAGKYRITDGTGYLWYGLTEMFGQDGKYETMIFEDGSDFIELRSGYDYTIKFNSEEHSDNGMTVGSKESDWFEITE